MLKRLHVCNFRCHEDFELAGLEACTLLIGDNGRGKTSLLEAVYFLSRCRSFRTHQTRELIRWGSQQLGVAGWFDDAPYQKLKIEWGEDSRNLAVDQSENLTFRDYWGRLPAVVFQNHDRQIVLGTAQARRHWADGLLASMNPVYLGQAQRAHLLLKQKNALLHQNNPDRNLWESLTTQLEEISRSLLQARQAFTLQARPLLEQFYQSLAGEKESLGFQYESPLPQLLAAPREALWQRERERGLARLGPHRDDWKISLFDKPLRDFGSEGQVKTAALALRLLETQLIRETTGQQPLLLLDDVLVELDPERQQRFWKQVPTQSQILYATTRPENFDFASPAREIRLGM